MQNSDSLGDVKSVTKEPGKIKVACHRGKSDKAGIYTCFDKNGSYVQIRIRIIKHTNEIAFGERIFLHTR